MKIWMYENGISQEVSSLLKLLLNKKNTDSGYPFVIAAAGAGGKTSLLWSLAQEACSMGMKTVLGTTTHMLLPREQSVLDGDEERAVELLNRNGIVCIGTPSEIKGSAVKCQKAPEVLREFLKAHADLILEEADGSRRLPAKYPRADEPVLNKDTDVVLTVMGLSSIGKTVGDAFHRYELYPGRLNAEEYIRPEHLAKALQSGYISRIPDMCSGAAAIPVLNQADTPGRISQAEEILSMLAGAVPYGLIACLRPEECPDR